MKRLMERLMARVTVFLRASWPWLIGTVVLVAVGLWWQLPKWQVHGLHISDAKTRGDLEDGFRKTITQLLAGIAVLVGAGLTYWQFRQQQRTTRDQFEAQNKASRDLLVSNQVAKGFELLGNKDKEITQRLGGIYALEGVMNTSEQYHRPVLEALCAFVREESKDKAIAAPAPTTDVQAALTVIGRRAPAPGLNIVDLHGAHLIGANLSGANLSGAELRGANLRFADLHGANLGAANLAGAILSAANLSGANLRVAGLIGADLIGADLRGASLSDALLPGANLSGTNLSGGTGGYLDLGRANLRNAFLSNADLTGADLSGAMNLTQEQLDQACGTAPRGLNTLQPPLTFHDKPCPAKQQ